MILSRLIALILTSWCHLPVALAATTPTPTPPPKPFVARRAIYCSGVRMSALYAWNEAVCFGRTPWRMYRLRVIGAGSSLQLVGSLGRLTIDFPTERYDQNFDPWPGEYYAVISGAAFGTGVGHVEAFAGNQDHSRTRLRRRNWI